MARKLHKMHVIFLPYLKCESESKIRSINATYLEGK